ncbi:MAG: hypothetical protein N2043_11875 [Ignavibacterium sp.]|nr:hypothetical protein [Ignavibacterium sp.]
MDVSAKIEGISYRPYMCRKLNEVKFSDLSSALEKYSSFILSFENNLKLAVSWWVSPKRTRSYPYARVYDTLSFSGKKVTIIPFVKDEGRAGDRDFLQWDTISLMSLLGVYVIIGYYDKAILSNRNKNKITKQRFNLNYLKKELNELLNYQSDALHWNLNQIEKLNTLVFEALLAYEKISKELGIELHSKDSAIARVTDIFQNKESFMNISRKLSMEAQTREVKTLQPKERLTGIKGTLCIKNFLGGYYYFTCDEIEIRGKNIFLIEAKHTSKNLIPSMDDIKDGLLKMILYTNLVDVKVNNESYKVNPVLKLTSEKHFLITKLKEKQKNLLINLRDEAKCNDFTILINDININRIKLI